MNNTTRRLPAEWEHSGAVLVALPHEGTDWAYMLEDVLQTYGNIIKAIADHAKVIVIGPDAPKNLPEGTHLENVVYIELPTNDTWTRDYGPITIVDGDEFAHIDYQFNGWGLKFASEKDNLATMRLCNNSILPYRRINRLGFELEGGSIDTDGKGFILTTASCLLNPNRNGDLDKGAIDRQLKEDLGAHTIAWLYNGELEGDDTDGHIDTLARILPPGDTIAYTACEDTNDSHYDSLKAMKEEIQKLRSSSGEPFRLVELPLPDPIYDPEDGTRLPATYANFLLINGAVIMPIYNQAVKDAKAIAAIRTALPDYEIVTVDCRALVRQHGSLHCATMQIPS